MRPNMFHKLRRPIWLGLAILALAAAGSAFSALQAQELRGDVEVRTTARRDGDAWRYKRHNGELWYWSPRDRWLYLRDGRWNVYVPGRFAPRYVDRGPIYYDRAPAYTRGRIYYDDGNYGPRRYPRSARRYTYYPYDRGYYNDGYRYGWDGRYRDPGFRQGANIGAAVGDLIGGRDAARIGAEIGGALGRD
jgi:hypothetical protein